MFSGGGDALPSSALIIAKGGHITFQSTAVPALVTNCREIEIVSLR